MEKAFQIIVCRNLAESKAQSFIFHSVESNIHKVHEDYEKSDNINLKVY